jgi:hypothetical protein
MRRASPRPSGPWSDDCTTWQTTRQLALVDCGPLDAVSHCAVRVRLVGAPTLAKVAGLEALGEPEGALLLQSDEGAVS